MGPTLGQRWNVNGYYIALTKQENVCVRAKESGKRFLVSDNLLADSGGEPYFARQ